jgi:ribosomal protein S18 acetylase RimI-like enzyme
MTGDSMEIIRAQENDLAEIMAVIGQAREFLRGLGIDQWQNGYPEPSVLEEDIRRGECHLAIDRGVAAGFFVLSCKPEISYGHIEGGNWLTSDEPYAVLHRMAVSSQARGQGVASAMMFHALGLSTSGKMISLRADTHRGNVPMQHLLEKSGFIRCGVIDLGPHYPGDSLRLAYERVL